MHVDKQNLASVVCFCPSCLRNGNIFNQAQMRYEPQDIVLSLRKREEKGKGITRQRERDGKNEKERG